MTSKLYTILFLTLVFHIFEIYSCPLNLKDWKDECEIYNKYNNLKKQYRSIGSDIENVTRYRALRLIDEDYYTNRFNEEEQHPMVALRPRPRVWLNWERGNRFREELGEYLKTNKNRWQLKRGHIKSLHQEAIDMKILGWKASAVARPGEVRSSQDLAGRFGISADEVKDFEKNPLKNKYGVLLTKVKKNRLFGGRRYVEMVNPEDASEHLNTLIEDVNERFPLYLNSLILKENRKKMSEGPYQNLSPLDFIATAQQLYVGIHPFSEGVGRTSRYLQDLMTQALGLPFIPGGMLTQDLSQSPEGYRNNTKAAINKMLVFLEKCLEEQKNYKKDRGRPPSKGCRDIERYQGGFNSKGHPNNPLDAKNKRVYRRLLKHAKKKVNHRLEHYVNCHINTLEAFDRLAHKQINQLDNIRRYGRFKGSIVRASKCVRDFAVKKATQIYKVYKRGMRHFRPNKFKWINDKCMVYNHQARTYVRYNDEKGNNIIRPCQDNIPPSYVWKKITDEDCVAKISINDPTRDEKLKKCSKVFCEGRTPDNVSIPHLKKSQSTNCYHDKKSNLVLKEEEKNGKTQCVAYAPLEGKKNDLYEFEVYEEGYKCNEIQGIRDFTDSRTYKNIIREGIHKKTFRDKLENKNIWLNFLAPLKLNNIFMRKMSSGLKNFLNRKQIYEGHVYRAVARNPKHKIGQTFKNNIYLSTSKTIPATKGFGNYIYQFKNKSGKDISQESIFPVEREVLIAPNTSYEVKSDPILFDPERHKEAFLSVREEEEIKLKEANDLPLKSPLPLQFAVNLRKNVEEKHRHYLGIIDDSEYLNDFYDFFNEKIRNKRPDIMNSLEELKNETYKTIFSKIKEIIKINNIELPGSNFFDSYENSNNNEKEINKLWGVFIKSLDNHFANQAESQNIEKDEKDKWIRVKKNKMLGNIVDKEYNYYIIDLEEV